MSDAEKLLTLAECREQVAAIRKHYREAPDEAHMMEDSLMREVLTAHLLDAPDTAAMAELVLELGREQHTRWFA